MLLNPILGYRHESLGKLCTLPFIDALAVDQRNIPFGQVMLLNPWILKRELF